MSELLDNDPWNITPEKGAGLFAMQLKIFPELMAEFDRLHNGSIGVVDAIIITMGEAISADPISETSVARVREVLGVPEDESQLDEWRLNFWGQFKAKKENS